ncbi:14278_t:CDS:2 [Funneliformis geosporum]|nr:14278_t:CDS:2 [Funneliformis geosporum]
MVEGGKHSAINKIKSALQSAGLLESDLTAAEETNLREIEDIESKVLADIKSKKDNEGNYKDKNTPKTSDEYSLEKNNKWRSGQEISSKITKIFVEVGLEIGQKGAEKQKATELNEVINKYENGNKSNKEELTNDLRNLNKNLGDEEPETKRKLRKAKKQMAQSDPDMYFNSFVELSQIEKELENLKNTSNTIDKQAYQANKQEITELSSKLSTISQNDTINNDGSIAPLVYLGIVILASFVGLLIILSQRKRQKN